MRPRYFVFTALIVLALLCTAGSAAAQENPATDVQLNGVTDDTAPSIGPIGAGNPLYGLKIAMEDLDETFTFNESLRVEKQLGHARLRIAEVQRELEINSSVTAQQALDLYLRKINLTEQTLAPFRSNATGLLHAQEMITNHQAVLENLLLSHPNNTGLMRAYNNSLRLEQKFETKTAIRLERIIEKNNRTLLRAVRLEIRERDRAGAADGDQTETEAPVRTGQQQATIEKQKEARQPQKVTSPPPLITTQPVPKTTAPSVASERTPNGGQGKGNGRGSVDETGRGNSRNK